MATKESIQKLVLKGMPYLVGLLFIFLILGLHMSKNMDSMLNENNNKISHVFLKSQINYHKEIAPFARRPLTTWFIETTSSTFDIKLGYSFIIINFFFLFLSGLFIYNFSKKNGAGPNHALVNMVIYFLTFSILFSFFPPVFSYDEPLQYCLILLALITFVGRKWVLYVLFFTLALIARETSVLLLPALLLFFPGLQKRSEKIFSSEHIKLLTVIVLPLFFYGLFIGLFIWKYELLEATKTELSSRYTCFLENFENKKNTVESVTSFFLTLGPFLYLTAIYLKGSVKPLFERRFINAFLLTVAINTPIVVLTAFARESRLFALPLFFIWPVFSQLFSREIVLLFSYKLYPQVFKKWPYLFAFLALNFLNYLFCFEFYKKLGLGENTYFAEYLFVVLLLITMHFLLRHFIQKLPNSEKIYPKLN